MTFKKYIIAQTITEATNLNEVTAVLKSFAEKSGKSLEKVEELWQKAKKIAEDDGQAENYAYITGILKKMLGLD